MREKSNNDPKVYSSEDESNFFFEDDDLSGTFGDDNYIWKLANQCYAAASWQGINLSYETGSGTAEADLRILKFSICKMVSGSAKCGTKKVVVTCAAPREGGTSSLCSSSSFSDQALTAALVSRG
jgi:hypothetical protein